jgi:ATP-dependent exoDNAse (exonuclease V) alpha subunit
VRAAFAEPVSVLTGGPGTGKTRMIEEVVAAARSADLEVALCAPTGRAAKRLEELESTNKTAEQKASEQLAAETRRADEAEKRSTALQVATEYHLGTEDAQLLAGMPDEDSMRSLGKRLADAAEQQRQADEAERRKGPQVPNQGRDMGDPKADPEREFARRLFGRTE